MSFRAVLFDQGNTLIEYSLQGRWREFCLERLTEMYPRVCDDSRANITCADFAEKMRDGIRTKGTEIERQGLSWYFTDRLRQALAEVGIAFGAAQLEQLVEWFYQPIRGCTKPYPETAEVLQKLKLQGLRLAVITNAPWDAPTYLVRGDLEHWEMTHYFDAFICSGEVPWRKPNPKFMFAAAEALCIEPEECLVVGDSLEADIAGAQSAGMLSAWVNRTGELLPPDAPQPDWEIRSLADLLEIVS